MKSVFDSAYCFCSRMNNNVLYCLLACILQAVCASKVVHLKCLQCFNMAVYLWLYAITDASLIQNPSVRQGFYHWENFWFPVVAIVVWNIILHSCESYIFAPQMLLLQVLRTLSIVDWAVDRQSSFIASLTAICLVI